MAIERRRVLIRESDLTKVTDPWVPHMRRKHTSGWKKISFETITKDDLMKTANWLHLKGNKAKAALYRHYDYPGTFVARLDNNEVYSTSYRNWLIKYNDDGEMEIRASLGHKKSRLGWGVFERVIPDEDVYEHSRKS